MKIEPPPTKIAPHNKIPNTKFTKILIESS